ncbi:hypothetical protein PRK78_003323 [Emydomyces testavorans]|uniref:Uncharacterized protein n=1 Tax=Emydomyces testavorans TaxID=2070801 RepID=A0AAF0DFU2_9EURO|nr:hypothetical protein PRK78_003323 [Emydomyces testavorans]
MNGQPCTGLLKTTGQHLPGVVRAAFSITAVLRDTCFCYQSMGSVLSAVANIILDDDRRSEQRHRSCRRCRSRSRHRHRQGSRGREKKRDADRPVDELATSLIGLARAKAEHLNVRTEARRHRINRKKEPEAVTVASPPNPPQPPPLPPNNPPAVTAAPVPTSVPAQIAAPAPAPVPVPVPAPAQIQQDMYQPVVAPGALRDVMMHPSGFPGGAGVQIGGNEGNSGQYSTAGHPQMPGQYPLFTGNGNDHETSPLDLRGRRAMIDPHQSVRTAWTSQPEMRSHRRYGRRRMRHYLPPETEDEDSQEGSRWRGRARQPLNETNEGEAVSRAPRVDDAPRPTTPNADPTRGASV